MKALATRLLAMALVVSLCAIALGDTIRLKDGSVIRGQIVGFRDQQFTVLIGSGARGRRSRITLFMEDVDSIEFDSAAGQTGDAGSGNGNGGNDTAAVYDAENTPRTNTRTTPAETRPSASDARSSVPANTTRNNTGTSSLPSSGNSSPAPQFFQINVRVRADNAANGWTNSGLVVRRGQRLRLTSSGRVSLGGGRFSTPTGLPRIADETKLMKNEPTGGLIAVIGDDNDDFIFIGSRREFTAQRDGILFLGVNEGKLDDNTGAYDTTIEAEALGGGL